MNEIIYLNGHPFIPHRPHRKSPQEMVDQSMFFFEEMKSRRSIRHFSPEPVPRLIIEHLLRTAGTAPSGAHKQPWTFCAVSDASLKHRIRLLAEEEERLSYDGRMSAEWLRDLEPLGTDSVKAFLETAPWLIVVFKRAFEYDHIGQKLNNYYVNESVGIAVGFLLAAVHRAGLCALTHTPSPMNFLQEALGRPDNERPFLLIPVGYPAADALIPDIHRKDLDEVAVWYE